MFSARFWGIWLRKQAENLYKTKVSERRFPSSGKALKPCAEQRFQLVWETDFPPLDGRNRSETVEINRGPFKINREPFKINREPFKTVNG